MVVMGVDDEVRRIDERLRALLTEQAELLKRVMDIKGEVTRLNDRKMDLWTSRTS